MRRIILSIWRFYRSNLLASLPNTVYVAATALVLLFISHRLAVPFSDVIGTAAVLNGFVYAIGVVSCITVSLGIVTLIAGDIERMTGDSGRFPGK